MNLSFCKLPWSWCLMRAIGKHLRQDLSLKWMRLIGNEWSWGEWGWGGYSDGRVQVSKMTTKTDIPFWLSRPCYSFTHKQTQSINKENQWEWDEIKVTGTTNESNYISDEWLKSEPERKNDLESTPTSTYEQNTYGSLKPSERKGRELSGQFLLLSLIKQCSMAIQQRGNLGNIFQQSALLVPTIRVLLRKKKGEGD